MKKGMKMGRYLLVFLSCVVGATLCAAQSTPRREFPPEGLEVPTIELIAREQSDIQQKENEIKNLQSQVDQLRSKLRGEVAIVNSAAMSRLHNQLVGDEKLSLAISQTEENKGRVVWVPVSSTNGGK